MAVNKFSGRLAVLFFFFLLSTFSRGQEKEDPWLRRYEKLIPLSFEQAMAGIPIPDKIKQQIILIDVNYWGYDGEEHTGQLLVNKDLMEEILVIFNELLILRFPIEKIIPVSRYNWSDDLSMQDNNTSCFNYRNIAGTSQVSLHAYGRAIDINPRNNPYIRPGRMEPPNGIYDLSLPGTIASDSGVVQIFKSFGWKWGGDWKYSKDYQHFYKE